MIKIVTDYDIQNKHSNIFSLPHVNFANKSEYFSITDWD